MRIDAIFQLIFNLTVLPVYKRVQFEPFIVLDLIDEASCVRYNVIIFNFTYVLNTWAS